MRASTRGDAEAHTHTQPVSPMAAADAPSPVAQSSSFNSACTVDDDSDTIFSANDNVDMQSMRGGSNSRHAPSSARLLARQRDLALDVGVNFNLLETTTLERLATHYRLSLPHWVQRDELVRSVARRFAQQQVTCRAHHPNTSWNSWTQFLLSNNGAYAACMSQVNESEALSAFLTSSVFTQARQRNDHKANLPTPKMIARKRTDTRVQAVIQQVCAFGRTTRVREQQLNSLHPKLPICLLRCCSPGEDDQYLSRCTSDCNTLLVVEYALFSAMLQPRAFGSASIRASVLARSPTAT
eukprot:1994968-Pleurochrysis_carterae.AAC.1